LTPTSKPHLDQKKIEQEKKNIAAMKEFIELNDEEGYVAFVKVIKPGISKDELKAAIELFRDLAAKRAY
jgi:hypothetical protein